MSGYTLNSDVKIEVSELMLLLQTGDVFGLIAAFFSALAEIKPWGWGVGGVCVGGIEGGGRRRPQMLMRQRQELVLEMEIPGPSSSEIKIRPDFFPPPFFHLNYVIGREPEGPEPGLAP